MRVASVLLCVLVVTLVTGYAVSRFGPVDGVAQPAVCPGCNIVLISLDTLRADHLGAYGYDKPTSPNIDALARRSILFEDAIGQTAWTRPAHISMLTGLYPSEHGVTTIADRVRFPSGVESLPEVLSRNGYTTAAFTGGGNMDAIFGFDRGFDVYESAGKRIWDNMEDLDVWLRDLRGEKFFLFVHGFEPHRPYKSDPVDREALGLPKTRAKGWARACKERKPPADMSSFFGDYDAAIHKGDRAIGRLMNTLSESGLSEKTIVLFTSDHGEAFFEHGRCFHIDTLYREIVHVPYIVNVPGLAPARVKGVVPASVSVARTLLDLVGAGNHSIPGPSLAKYLQEESADEGFVISETSTRLSLRKVGRVRAVTTDRDKLIHWPDKDFYEYFDLESDPDERDPTTALLREWVLRRHLAGWEASHRPVVKPSQVESLPRPLEKKLRAMGYVSD